MNCNSNGRVDILGNNAMDCFHLYDRIAVSQGDTYYRTAMTGNWDNSMLTKTFFSADNMRILQNGIKYTQCGGELKVSLQNDGKFALMVIQDTGMGIPEEDLEFIFNRFYRVDKARSRAEGGSGLGLSICRQIAEAHKGSIEVESKLGVGTRFKIRIPQG